MSSTDTVIPGRFKIRDPPPYFSFGISFASTRFFITVLAEHTQISTSRETGNSLFFPFRGSLIIPLQNDDAAPNAESISIL